MNRSKREAELTKTLPGLARAWSQAFERALRDPETPTAPARALLVLSQLGDGMRQVDLASALDISPASLVRLVDALAAQKLVRRAWDGVDRRVRRVVLTKLGHIKCAEFAPRVDKLRRDMLGAIPDGDLDVTLRVLCDLNGGLLAHTGAQGRRLV